MQHSNTTVRRVPTHLLHAHSQAPPALGVSRKHRPPQLCALQDQGLHPATQQTRLQWPCLNSGQPYLATVMSQQLDLGVDVQVTADLQADFVLAAPRCYSFWGPSERVRGSVHCLLSLVPQM